MPEYMQHAFHTFFPTTTTPHCYNTKLGQKQQTNFEAHTHWGGGSRPHLFINSSFVQLSIPFISLGVPLRRSPMKQGKTKSRRPHSPKQTEGLHTLGCGMYNVRCTMILNFIFMILRLITVFLSSLRNFNR